MEKREGEIRMFDSSEELSTSLVDYVYQISETAIRERGSFSLVLSGGDIPNCLSKLTRAPYIKMVDWSKWYLFWAEENVVATKRHPDSLYKQAKDAFFSKVPIPSSHIISVSHGVSGESAANSYEFTIRQQVRNRTVAVSPSSDCPRFDLVLLKLGPNGHVASLYPNHPVLEENSQWVAWVSSSDGSTKTVTLTLPVINAAANVAIVASGPNLGLQVAEVMIGPKPNISCPTQLVRPKYGNLDWFVIASTD